MRLLKIIVFSSFLCIAFTAIKAQIITTVAGNGTSGFSGDGGAAVNAQLGIARGITLDAAGNLFIADRGNNCIRKVNTAGIITTIAGNGNFGFSGDGGLATLAELNSPTGVVVDKKGNIYISDFNNNRIRKIDTFGIITTIAGSSLSGQFAGDGGQATLAKIDNPYGLAIDKIGNIYIADTYNNRIRKVDTSGIISTVAGNGILGFSGDGGLATLAALSHPYGVAVDTLGNIFIVDVVNNCIRKVDTLGIINTIVGTSTMGFSGDGGPANLAELQMPLGVAVDLLGNIYIGDSYNNRVRKIDAYGMITTIAGNGTSGFSGDGGLATNAELYVPIGITTNLIGDVYIADHNNFRIRKVSAPTAIKNYLDSKNINVFPSPSNGLFIASFDGKGYSSLRITDLFGREVYKQSLDVNKENIDLQIDISDVANGIYFMQVQTPQGIINKRIEVQR